MLELKEISYKVEKINMHCYGTKPASFSRMQPSGAIPVAIIDGTTYKQSDDIILTLEQTFSTPDHLPLSPHPADQQTASTLLRLERSFFSSWLQYLTSSSGRASFVSKLARSSKRFLRLPRPSS